MHRHCTDLLPNNGYGVCLLDDLAPQVHGPERRRPPYLAEDAESIVGVPAIFAARVSCLGNPETSPAMTPRKLGKLQPYPRRPRERLGPTDQSDSRFVSVHNAREQKASPSSEC